MLQCYEIACSQCGEFRWPALHEKPETYVCYRCRSVPEETRARRAEAGQRAQATKKSRQGTP
jgi:hypothetical protein